MKKRTLLFLVVISMLLMSCGSAHNWNNSSIEYEDNSEVYSVEKIFRYPSYNSTMYYYIIYKDQDGKYHEYSRFDPTDYHYNIETGSNQDTIIFVGSEVTLRLQNKTYLEAPIK